MPHSFTSQHDMPIILHLCSEPSVLTQGALATCCMVCPNHEPSPTPPHLHLHHLVAQCGTTHLGACTWAQAHRGIRQHLPRFQCQGVRLNIHVRDLGTDDARVGRDQAVQPSLHNWQGGGMRKASKRNCERSCGWMRLCRPPPALNL